MKKITVSFLFLAIIHANNSLAYGSGRDHQSSAVFYFVIAVVFLVVGLILKNLPGKDNNTKK